MKPMIYKEEDGTKYKISFSEELQLKNLKAVKENTMWQKRHFYIKTLLTVILAVLTAAFLFIMYRLEVVNFFSTIMYR